MTVTGVELKAIREARGAGQQEFADWLNGHLARKYDRARISKWESGAERIPQKVADFLSDSPKEPVAAPSPTRSPSPALPPSPTRASAPPLARTRRNALVVAIANHKGGVGKTTTAVNLAALLTADGLSVVLIDADPQANATMHLGIDPREVERTQRTLYYVLRRDVPLASVLMPVDDSPLRLVPSSIRLSEAEDEMIGDPYGATVLRERLREIRTSVDVVIIDCPPHAGILTANALASADQVLIPCQTEGFAQLGVPFLLNTIERAQRHVNPDLRILGILPTMYKHQQLQDRQTLAELRDAYGTRTRLFDPVPRSTLYAQGSTSGRATLTVEPNAPGAESYRAVADALRALAHEPEGAADGRA